MHYFRQQSKTKPIIVSLSVVVFIGRKDSGSWNPCFQEYDSSDLPRFANKHSALSVCLSASLSVCLSVCLSLSLSLSRWTHSWAYVECQNPDFLENWSHPVLQNREENNSCTTNTKNSCCMKDMKASPFVRFEKLVTIKKKFFSSGPGSAH